MVSWEYPPIVEGGLARAVRKLSEALAADGTVEVHVLTRGGAHGVLDEVRHGVHVHRVRAPASTGRSTRSATASTSTACASPTTRRRCRSSCSGSGG